jgi:hypothetical protein
VSCIGLYADVEPDEEATKEKMFHRLQHEYTRYKNNFAPNLKFDPTHKDLSMTTIIFTNNNIHFSASPKSIPQLQFVQIAFGTATYDKIEKDVKVTVEAQLSLIGGTMGLLTGFSLLSAVEIIYFAIKFFLSLRISKTDVKENSL